MKIRILLAIFIVLLLISSSVSASIPHFKKDIDKETGKSKISYKPSSFTPTKTYSSTTGSSRTGIVSGDVAEYKIKVKVGSGKYDYIVLTNYVKEKEPWKIETTKNLVILPGQAMTEKFYSEMAIYFAQQGYSAYILDRRETNIPSTETDFSFMKSWTVNQHLKDTYQGIATSRIHTALLNGNSTKNIEVIAIGHSHGALLLTSYEASKYDDLASGSVDKLVPVDIVIKYNPGQSALIQSQAEEYNAISEDIRNGTYYDTNMAVMMQIANLALADPQGTSPIQPPFTNIQFFRLLASQTYAFSEHPYTDDYHYWTGSQDELQYVDENRLLDVTLTGGAVPYSPKYMDQYMAGLMGNVEGYKIDTSKVDSPLLYVGLGGGFGDYGSWWYKNEVGKTNNNVTVTTWSNQGHASVLIDSNSPELWKLINDWMKK